MFTTRIISSVSQKTLIGLQVLMGSIGIGLLAQIKIPLFFTPVPLSFQTFAVMLMTLLLGPRKGPLAVLSYLFLGAVGIPFFAGGASGISCLIGPTGGYLVGFLAQSLLISRFLILGSSYTKTFFVLLLSSFVQIGLGLVWLAQFVGFEKVIYLGFFPFVIGDLLKILAVTSLCAQKKTS